MSVRNPLTIIKQQIYTARHQGYYIKKLRGTDELVDYIDGEVRTILSPKLRDDALKAWIRDIITSRFEQTDGLTDKIDLFHDLDFQFAFRKHGTAYQRTLGDLTLEEVERLEKRKATNIVTVQREYARFVKVATFIKPLLQAHPDWLWRDAVAYLDSHGGLPAGH